MGNRANVAVIDEYEPSKRVYLYTHWDGDELPFIVQEALARKERWDQGPWLTRIIFSHMVKDNLMDDSGHGISTRVCDNQHPIIVVDVANNRISFEQSEGYALETWSFEQYITLSRELIKEAYQFEGEAN